MQMWQAANEKMLRTDSSGKYVSAKVEGIFKSNEHQVCMNPGCLKRGHIKNSKVTSDN